MSGIGVYQQEVRDSPSLPQERSWEIRSSAPPKLSAVKESTTMRTSETARNARPRQKKHTADTNTKLTRGFEKAGVVPRNRIELLTRGFSVRCSTY
jgi:hypothetical protein